MEIKGELEEGVLSISIENIGVRIEKFWNKSSEENQLKISLDGYGRRQEVFSWDGISKGEVE